MTKKLHWTQTPEGRERMRQIATGPRSPLKKARASKRKKELAKAIVKTAKKRSPYKKEKKETSLVINGWRITLGKNEVRIDND